MTYGNLDMGYIGFCMQMKELLNDEFGEHAEILFREVTKNNGTRKKAMMIIEPGILAVPTFYMDELYSKMSGGMSTEDIARAVICSYKQHRYDFDRLPEPLAQKDSFLTCLRIKMINTETNEELLKNVPSEAFLDLSVVTYVEIEVGEGMTGEAVVGYEDLSRMNVTPKEAMSAAKRNTFVKDPPRCETIERMIEEARTGLGGKFDFPYERETGGASVPLYVLTRTSGKYGAVCILITELFEELSRRLDSSLMILPSSVNELIVLADDSECPDLYMKQAVYEINRSCLAPTEVLSDSVYRYSPETHRIELI